MLIFSLISTLKYENNMIINNIRKVKWHTYLYIKLYTIYFEFLTMVMLRIVIIFINMFQVALFIIIYKKYLKSVIDLIKLLKLLNLSSLS